MTKGRKAFSRPPSQKVNEEYGMKVRKKVSKGTADLGKGLGNTEPGFRPRTLAAATGGGKALKAPQPPGQFKALTAPGNNDFGYIGASAPAPMMPKKKGRRGF
jgi:hypothetical protein